MHAAAIPTVPPTLTPIHDIGNRWTAMRLNLPTGAQVSGEMLACLYGSKDNSGNSSNDGAQSLIADLPLLIETNDPHLVGKALEVTPPTALLYLLVPQNYCVSSETKAVLTRLEALNVFTVVNGLNANEMDEWTHGIAFDCAAGVPAGVINALPRFNGPRLATDIASNTHHHECVKAGFQWFEGNWAIQPESDSHKPLTKPTTSRNLLLNLLGLVVSDADSHKIEDLLKQDPNLSYQLLKLVNSVSFSLTHKINNFGQAITLLGRRQLQRWLQLLLYAGHYVEGATSPLLGRAAMRAALVEALAEAQEGTPNQQTSDQAFMVGMFSLLGVLFNEPLDSLVIPLNLNAAVSDALIKREGLLGRQLAVVVAAEAPPDEALGEMLAEINISPEVFFHAQIRASTWALQICRDI